MGEIETEGEGAQSVCCCYLIGIWSALKLNPCEISLGAYPSRCCCIKNHNKSAVSDIYLCALCVWMFVRVGVCAGPVRFRMLYALF